MPVKSNKELLPLQAVVDGILLGSVKKSAWRPPFSSVAASCKAPAQLSFALLYQFSISSRGLNNQPFVTFRGNVLFGVRRPGLLMWMSHSGSKLPASALRKIRYNRSNTINIYRLVFLVKLHQSPGSPGSGRQLGNARTQSTGVRNLPGLMPAVSFCCIDKAH